MPECIPRVVMGDCLWEFAPAAVEALERLQTTDSFAHGELMGLIEDSKAPGGLGAAIGRDDGYDDRAPLPRRPASIKDPPGSANSRRKGNGAPTGFAPTGSRSAHSTATSPDTNCCTRLQQARGVHMPSTTIPVASEESRRATKMTRDLRRVIRDLKAVREARGLSASHVADLIGVHRSVISKFENQVGDPKISTLLRYAHAVGADLELTVVSDSNEAP